MACSLVTHWKAWTLDIYWVNINEINDHDAQHGIISSKHGLPLLLAHVILMFKCMGQRFQNNSPKLFTSSVVPHEITIK